MRNQSKGVVYYIDINKGRDTNNGTSPQSPWKTLEAVNKKVFQPGDQILLEAHGVWSGGLQLQGSGQEGEPIVVDNYTYNEEILKVGVNEIKPIIHGEGKVLYTLWLHNISFWEINNLEITNQGEEPLTGRTGVVVSGDDTFDQAGGHVLKHIYLNHLYVHDVNGDATTKDGHNGGIYYHIFATHQDKLLKFKDIVVQNCYIKDVARTGLSVGSTQCLHLESNLSHHTPEELKYYLHEDVVIRNNYVERSGGDAIVPQYCYEPLIEHNVSQEASIGTRLDPNLMYNAAIWPWQCFKALFQYNEAFGTYLNGDGQAYDCDFSWGTTYEYNYSHDNEGGFMLVCQANAIDSVVRYNISQNDRRCLFMTSNVEPAYIYNNTFYIGDNVATKIFSNDHGPMIFYNNIFYREGKGQEVDWHEACVTYDTNLYYGFEHTPEDTYKVLEDPLFVNAGTGGQGNLEEGPALDTLQGYTLQSISSALVAGRSITKSMLPAIIDEADKDFESNELVGESRALGAINYGLQIYTSGQRETYTNYQEKMKACRKIIRSGRLSEAAIKCYYEANKEVMYRRPDTYELEFEGSQEIVRIDLSNRGTYARNYPQLIEHLEEAKEGQTISGQDLAGKSYEAKCLKRIANGYFDLKEVRTNIEMRLAQDLA